MVEQNVVIQNPLGLHARTCAVFVKVANQYASHITVGRDGLEVNGKSILGVMMLAAEYGAELTLRAEGNDEEKAIETMVQLVNDKFGLPD